MFSFCYAHVLQINPLLPFDIFSGTHVRPCVQVATPLTLTAQIAIHGLGFASEILTVPTASEIL